MARVLVIGDTHCPCMHAGYLGHLQSVHKRWKLDRVVHIGDLVDWTAISFHASHPGHPSAEAEYQLALTQVGQIRKAFPEATVLLGNHDTRPARLSASVNIPDFLLKTHADIWCTPKWSYIDRYGEITIDNVRYCHGEVGRTGREAALKNAIESFAPTVQGHLHSQCGTQWWCNSRRKVFGMQVGCGIDIKKLQFLYARKFTHRPILGCGVVIDGEHAFVDVMNL